MPITSNSVALPVAPEPMRVTVPDNADELRSQFRRDGYILVRGVLHPEKVWRMREAYFKQFNPSYLAPGTYPREGVWSGLEPEGLPSHGVAGHPAHTFVRSKVFANFVSDPHLLQLAEILLDEIEVMRLPRQIVRHFHKGAAASRAHTDFDYLDRGSDRVLTMWIPLGDCPLETGGLAYLEGSHRLPKPALDVLKHKRTDRPHDSRPLSHDLGWVSEQLGGRWLYADYQAGDVAIHSPHIVHATFDTTTDAMRLSADIRFVPITVEPDPRWLRPWSGDDGN
jgi:hypothetical protein